MSDTSSALHETDLESLQHSFNRMMTMYIVTLMSCIEQESGSSSALKIVCILSIILNFTYNQSGCKTVAV